MERRRNRGRYNTIEYKSDRNNLETGRGRNRQLNRRPQSQGNQGWRNSQGRVRFGGKGNQRIPVSDYDQYNYDNDYSIYDDYEQFEDDYEQGF